MRVVCCKCRFMRTTDEMDQVVGCLGSKVWLCKVCSAAHHKEQVREILKSVQAQGVDISKWAHLLK